MTSPRTHVTYEIDPGEWESLNVDLAVRNDPTIGSTIRAHGLHGLVRLRQGAAELTWIGFLLDVACALAEWLQEPEKKLVFLPLAQAHPLTVEPHQLDTAFRVGGDSLTVSRDGAITLVRHLLGELAVEASTNGPGLLGVPGFEWVGAMGARPRLDRTRGGSGRRGNLTPSDP